MSGDQNSAVTGSNTHPHSNINITSGGFYAGASYSTNTAYATHNSQVPGSHSHVIVVGFANANHEPINVQLYPVKLNTTLHVGGLMASACLF